MTGGPPPVHGPVAAVAVVVPAKDEADAVAGTIEVDDWSDHSAGVCEQYLALLRSRLLPGDRHTHAYGANLGVRASAYLAVGGFPDVVGEDKALGDRLRDAGYDVRQPSTLVRDAA